MNILLITNMRTSNHLSKHSFEIEFTDFSTTQKLLLHLVVQLGPEFKFLI